MSSHSLLGYLSEHKPDLERREYLKKLGLPTSQIELPGDGGSLMNTDGKVLSVPPAPKTRITPSGNSKRDWVKSVRGDGGDSSGSSRDSGMGHGGQSLVTPLMWVPGVLRSQGAWATAMRDTIHGPVMAVQPGVSLIKSEVLYQKNTGPSKDEQLAAKDQLIHELERSVAKQKLVVDKVVHKSKQHARLYSKMMEEASREERSRNEEALGQTVGVMTEKLKSFKSNLRTTNLANSARLNKAYAQDNFLSQYSRILTTVQERAKAIADTEHTSLVNQVSALKRGLRKDISYKRALKERTEVSEDAAERRWLEAENKIPPLERFINDQHARAAQLKMFEQERSNRQRREMDRLNTLLRREQEARAAAEAQCQALQKSLDRSINTPGGRNSPGSRSPHLGAKRSPQGRLWGDSQSPSPSPVRVHAESQDKAKAKSLTRGHL